MKLNSKFIVQLTAGLLVLSVLSACAKAPQASCEFNQADNNVDVSKEISIVIAPNIGFVDFENVLASTMPKIQELFKDQKNASLAIVLADGNPEIESNSIIEVELPFSSQTDVDEEVDNAISEISRVYRCALGLDGVTSRSSEESNLTLALSKAAGAFETSGTQREIFVLSNGISTSGQVNFTDAEDGIPTLGNYENRVNDLESALIDLKGANVSWIGLGQTDGEYQKNFDTQVIEALTKFWTLYVEKSNGVAGSIQQGNVVNGTPNRNSLRVSPVGPRFEKVCASADLGIDQGLVFVENSPEFKSPSTARASIQDIANEINESSCFGKVIVTGYVSSDQEKSTFDRVGDKPLSLKRANAVSDVLEEFGVSNIEVIGAGWGEIDEWNSDGSYNNELGEKNRIVKIREEK